MIFRLEEEILEPIVRWLRFRESVSLLRDHQPKTVVDLGCGPEIRFYTFCKRNNIFFEKYIGVDPLLSDAVINKNRRKNVSLKKSSLEMKIPLKDASADCVVGFAFLEHIDNPAHIVNETIRVLEPGGIAVFTTPSKIAQPILEFLSYKLGLISRREIEEHKTYFTREMLYDCISDEHVHIVDIQHTYFEFGVNNLFVLRKKEG